MDPAKVAQLKLLIDQCKLNPFILRDPSLSFLKNYLESLGARIPPDPNSVRFNFDFSANIHVKQESGSSMPDSKPSQKAEYGGIKDELGESDIEFDGEVVDPDNDPPQKMGDPSVEVSEENRDAAQMSKAKAIHAISEGKLNEAVEHLTEAVLFNPTSSILYASRASVFVKMCKPNAAIRDADAALEINPDSAKGYKARGMAKALLGKWEEAARDLRVASKLDHDEEIGFVLKRVEPNVHKIEEHHRKYDLLRKEREMKKNEHESRRQQARTEDKQNVEALAALQAGQVISIHSSNELETKFWAASSLSRLVILYFTATWCGPCRFMGPLFKELAGKHSKVVFMKIDIDELGDVAHHWKVNSVPTFFFVKNGKEIDKLVGADKSNLERKITQHAG